MVGQAITDPISGPSFDFFTIGPELDNLAIILLEYPLLLRSNIIHHNLDDHICTIDHS